VRAALAAALLLLVLLTVLAVHTGRPVVWLLVTVLALLWLRVNAPVEGPTLLPLTHDHGATLADVPSVAALALLVRWVWTSRRR
jgi:hypothetical protein